MTAPRVPIFERLPAIHRIRDAEQAPPDQLRAFTALFERAFGEIHADIEALYHDLFVETCAPWVIPYLADLLGSSHLSGDPWTLRAELADTIALRRRKGTRGALERLAYDLTGWAVHAVELRDRLVWAQHLNHQRPDAGGESPYAGTGLHIAPRGGTVPLRDPAMLSLLDTAFDPFAHIPDLRPPAGGAVRHNLPNVALFTWRLAHYTVPAATPDAWSVPVEIAPVLGVTSAPYVARFALHPVGDNVVLFNRHSFDPDARPMLAGELDGMPGPMPGARLTTGAPAGNPDAYVTLDVPDPAAPTTLTIADTGLTLHLPAGVSGPMTPWRFRGATLCEWEAELGAPLAPYEIAIDPVIGRLAIGAPTYDLAARLIAELRVSYTYGAVGPIGAHPIAREVEEAATVRVPTEAPSLAAALAHVPVGGGPLIVEIVDSGTYELDLGAVPGHVDEGGPTLALDRSLVVRAADGQRPVVTVTRPLAFCPRTLGDHVSGLTVRFEGLLLTAGEALDPAEPLIRRAAIHALELVESTLDPEGGLDEHGVHRAPIRIAIRVAEPYGFDSPDEAAFDQIPELHIRRSITGPILADRGYRVFLTDSIVDAGTGPHEDPAAAAYAIAAATGDPAVAWGPPVQVDGVTMLGRVRADRVVGQGGLFAQPLEVLDDQHGCLKWCWFAATGNRLPQRYACLSGADARLIFTSEAFGSPGYAQLADRSDLRIRELGPRDDAMGATGFLLHAHRTRNLHIRYRELMPVGIRAVLVLVT